MKTLKIHFIFFGALLLILSRSRAFAQITDSNSEEDEDEVEDEDEEGEYDEDEEDENTTEYEPPDETPNIEQKLGDVVKSLQKITSEIETLQESSKEEDIQMFLHKFSNLSLSIFGKEDLECAPNTVNETKQCFFGNKSLVENKCSLLEGSFECFHRGVVKCRHLVKVESLLTGFLHKQAQYAECKPSSARTNDIPRMSPNLHRDHNQESLPTSTVLPTSETTSTLSVGTQTAQVNTSENGAYAAAPFVLNIILLLLIPALIS